MRPRLALRKEARGACGDTTRAVRSGGDRRNHLAAVDGDAAPIGWRKSGATGLLPGLFARCVTVVWLAATDKEAGADRGAGRAHARIAELLAAISEETAPIWRHRQPGHRRSPPNRRQNTCASSSLASKTRRS